MRLTSWLLWVKFSSCLCVLVLLFHKEITRDAWDSRRNSSAMLLVCPMPNPLFLPVASAQSLYSILSAFSPPPITQPLVFTYMQKSMPSREIPQAPLGLESTSTLLSRSPHFRPDPGSLLLLETKIQSSLMNFFFLDSRLWERGWDGKSLSLRLLLLTQRMPTNAQTFTLFPPYLEEHQWSPRSQHPGIHWGWPNKIMVFWSVFHRLLCGSSAYKHVSCLVPFSPSLWHICYSPQMTCNDLLFQSCYFRILEQILFPAGFPLLLLCLLLPLLIPRSHYTFFFFFLIKNVTFVLELLSVVLNIYSIFNIFHPYIFSQALHLMPK